MNRIWIVGLIVAVAACAGEDPEWLEAATGQTGTAAAAEAPAPAAAGPAAEVEAGGEASEAQRRVVFVDVRTPAEFADGHVEGAIHIPHTELGARWSELEEYRGADIVLYCRTGRRSGIAEEILRDAGFEHLHNGGGLGDLQRRGIPTTR